MNTAKEFASMFDGREYGAEVSANEHVMLKDAGLVAVFGASDDLMTFRGAITDEAYCWGGGIVHVDENGLLENECENSDCPHFVTRQNNACSITAVWNDGSESEWDEDHAAAWSYATSIPHETFNIFDDGDDDSDVYCAGIVFALKDAKQEKAA